MKQSQGHRRRQERDEPSGVDSWNDVAGAGHRHERLEQLVLREIDGLLRDEIGDPSLQSARVVRVVLSADYRHARVHYTVDAGQIADRRSVEAAFVRTTPFLRRRLADAIELKRVPDLRFVFDAEVAQ